MGTCAIRVRSHRRPQGQGCTAPDRRPQRWHRKSQKKVPRDSGHFFQSDPGQFPNRSRPHPSPRSHDTLGNPHNQHLLPTTSVPYGQMVLITAVKEVACGALLSSLLLPRHPLESDPFSKEPSAPKGLHLEPTRCSAERWRTWILVRAGPPLLADCADRPKRTSSLSRSEKGGARDDPGPQAGGSGG